MKVGIPIRVTSGETRVAMVPQIAKRLLKMDCEVVIQASAGLLSFYSDTDYEQAGVTVTDNEQAIWQESDVVLVVEPPTEAQARMMKRGAVLVGMLGPLANLDLMKTLRDQGITVFAMEFLPRISRAQSMDVLSSQANLGGYKAVLLAADASAKMFPMMITAAGTIKPAKVFVIGAGVAGLQAIATAKRLGATVEAYDVRAVTKEQVQSLGGRFVELPTAAQDDAATGGYAKEQTEDDRKQQTDLMAKHVIGADITITTAAVFGKAPPMLIPKDVVDQIAAGSVIIDMAASREYGRGNCECTQPGEVITTENGVKIFGYDNLPAMLSANASQVYANNMLAFSKEFLNGGQIKIDLENEVIQGALITHNGEVTNELVKQALANN
ncbi:Re/Si-specific NAD(P)(+) transhydrogenase subunit alpha [Poriferisphaera sp. WC338]|uniref:Re/Si-specific NAD(P)(+) transhydrogenase subunit alpha n=1 Tax=Poriferisphaera sp. WC338 TaxID=3425129 RepID=UPI003D81C1D1